MTYEPEYEEVTLNSPYDMRVGDTIVGGIPINPFEDGPIVRREVPRPKLPTQAGTIVQFEGWVPAVRVGFVDTDGYYVFLTNGQAVHESALKSRFKVLGRIDINHPFASSLSVFTRVEENDR